MKKSVLVFLILCLSSFSFIVYGKVNFSFDFTLECDSQKAEYDRKIKLYLNRFHGAFMGGSNYWGIGVLTENNFSYDPFPIQWEIQSNKPISGKINDFQNSYGTFSPIKVELFKEIYTQEKKIFNVIEYPYPCMGMVSCNDDPIHYEVECKYNDSDD